MSTSQHWNVPAACYFADRDEDTIEQRLRDRANQTLSWMQPGLIYPAPWQCALSVFDLPPAADRAAFAHILSQARRRIHQDFGSLHASVCLAFSLRVWSGFCEAEGRPVPSGLAFDEPGDTLFSARVIERSGGVLRDSEAGAWFIVKADEAAPVAALADFLSAELEMLGIAAKDIYRVDMHSRNNPTVPTSGKGGRVLGGRYKENLRNPASPVEILEHVLVGHEDPLSAGGAFLFTQRFRLNWAELHSKAASEMEAMVGRRQFTDELVPSFDARSHIRSAHTHDADGHTIKLLRIGLPFGERDEADKGTPLIDHAGGSSAGDEKGIYFIGMARAASRIEAILRSQFGNADDGEFARDRLLAGSAARSDLGGFFYVPSIRELGAEAIIEDAHVRSTQPFSDWRRFPGIDWSRLNRHYEKRSANGLMYYNHQDYLFAMGTREDETAQGLKPPSLRLQYLLERMFARWDDTWFRAQKPDDLAPLRPQLERFFADPRNEAERDALRSGASAKEAADLIMRASVAVRAGWANRLVCNLAARLDGVGRRGNGGMDTCDIHPLDLLAGSMPAQSLAEGRYFIDYVRDDDGDEERYRWFSLGLGPNSGVGHVVPGYQDLLDKGISGLFARIDAAEAALKVHEPDRAAKAVDFYMGARLATKGLAEYLEGLADTVKAKAQTLTPTQTIERENLTALENRLRWLAAGNAPRTVLEALQLVFSGHATLHLCGEPVAVGRLDRLLRPFQERENLSEAELQDAIDGFWIKLAEKVLLNRIFIDDRQQLGNMAMGNRAGPYPKGQSVNQWIQQLTVGGRNPDGSWEYSDVTLACLRAAARLPFNAPVLSLRVGKDMPAEWRDRLLREAALGQLSGGASPILMNDDKIIPAMAGSGIALRPDSPNASRWNAQVRPEDAHDYAADGCYEPQFVGANWFHLGGVVLLQPLEYALNQGRQIQSAGPVDLFGKSLSFRSPPASEITAYEELEALFFRHLEWSYARQMEGTVADFGRMEPVCPAPLLDLFINDCLEKGQDIYGGGARYNVFGPCFTSLANTINALWALRSLCFQPETAVTSLPELVQALLCNWGESMIDPLVHSTLLTSDHPRVAETARRFRHLRTIALSLPRWGRGHADIDAFGNRIAARVATVAMDVMARPRPALAALYEQAAARFGTVKHPFGGFSMQPGVGTFASYVEQGLGCAASADGRLSAQPLATDMSPAPSPVDQPATADSRQQADGVAVLEGLRSADAFGYANGAPIDLNVAESMPVERLVEILEAFTGGAGSNVLTVTVAGQQTFLSAAGSPEAYDLLRVRMGGWTEMFVAMHALHQRVHPRRPYSV
ncbi:Dyp-type peroxidase [Asticcacaulis sp. AND118]|uniref:Dyp-type peroxidase n=1 Tax=Asticcacaulis sp. AND118 TaxID=2840468 RepID=UPI001CFF7D5E|nr:Dyp-type peroxidase [Asticcacaulis sp. AND118]UDF05740.1 Dyp-type peroxidase [Asticcacaulis sp. AND118]